MRRNVLLAASTALVIAGAAIADERIRLEVDDSEAAEVLAILDASRVSRPVPDESWRALFTTRPYVRLKDREASFRRDFTDDDFRKFVLSPDLAARSAELARTLAEWKKADLPAAARRVLAYLPSEASIHARVYLVIKPQTNSFVFGGPSDPAIFLYLDPKVSPAKFENTVAHELHHIGFASIEAEQENALARLTPNVRAAVEWLGAFGEGFAMLAAAGGPDVHPHVASTPEDRARWDHDMERVDADVKMLDRFFLDVVDGRLKTKGEIEERALSFFGIQGPWYTVGYRIAVLIEKNDGRAALVACMADPRKALAAYDRIAAELEAKGSRPARFSRASERPQRVGSGLLTSLRLRQPTC